MTISIELTFGDSIERKIYRNIARHNYSAYVAGFFANQDNYQSGVMYQLKGKEKKLLHSFGKTL